MSDNSPPVIRLTGVSKSYMIYSAPKYWLADFLGFRRFLKAGKHYRSFWALRGIDLEIPRGGKYAVIGRNGAGKSTLLRIISDNIAPTVGVVETRGRCETLMELGTGFHPEATGRENIYTSLAYKGITGKAAEEVFWDVVDFSELDEFLDQPVKTYSSGMYLRLAFSVATVMAPDILIIDEILSAGDLYFQAKCLERIQSLAAGPGVTILFVTHDLNAARRLCDTFIWIDRGRIVKVGPGPEIAADYNDFIRKQKEIRIRARNFRLSEKPLTVLKDTDEEGGRIFGRFMLNSERQNKSGGPSICGIRLYVRGKLQEEIRVGDAMDDSNDHYRSFIIPSPEESAWGEPEECEGRLCRRVRRGKRGDSGAHFALFLAYDDFHSENYSADLEVVYLDASELPCYVELHTGVSGLKRMLTLEHSADGTWKTARLTIPKWLYTRHGSAKFDAEHVDREVSARESKHFHEGDNDQEQRNHDRTTALRPKQCFGTGQVKIDRFVFLDEKGTEQYVFQHGHPLIIETTYRTEDLSLLGTTMIMVLSFRSLNGVIATMIVSTIQDVTITIRPSGKIRLNINPLLLGGGSYIVTPALFSKLDLHGYNPHFTQSSELYDMHVRAYEISVEGSYRIECDHIYRQPVKWEVPER